MSKGKIVSTVEDEVMELSPTEVDRDIESRHSDSASEHHQDQGRQGRNTSRSPRRNSSSRSPRRNSRMKSGARNQRPQDDRRKRWTREEETQDKRKRGDRDSATTTDGWAQGQLDLLKERLQLIGGATLLYEILLSLDPLTFSSRQDLLSTALLHCFLQHVARKAGVFKDTRSLSVKEIEELNSAIHSGPFGLHNITDQWKNVKVQGIIYRHSEAFAFWSNCPRQLPHALIRMTKDMRLNYGLSEREQNLIKAENIFGVTTDVHRLDKRRVFNPFEGEFTTPDPETPDCLARQLAAAKDEAARAKNAASKKLGDATQATKKLQLQLEEEQKCLQEAEGQVKALRSQLNEIMNQKSTWVLERESMVEEARLLQEEHNSLIVENEQLSAELKKEKAKPQMVEKGELTALLQQLLPASGNQSPPRRIVEERIVEETIPAAGRNRIRSESDME